MFGEVASNFIAWLCTEDSQLVCLWLCTQYFGKIEPIRIVELGPGRGTLMDDMLRVRLVHRFRFDLDTQHQVLTKFHPSQTFDVHLVETSQNMRALQEAKLAPHKNVRLHWHNSITELRPSWDKFTFIVAHEFFDALPVYVIQASPCSLLKKMFLNMLNRKQRKAGTTFSLHQ